MNRIDRLFGMLTFLQSRKFVTAEALAERFSISVRTVYRDIKALGEQGIPVSFETGRGYFIVSGYFLPPVAFSTEEAAALLLMESVVTGFADASIRRQYGSALQKIKSVLRGSQKETLERLSDGMRFQVPERLYNHFEYLTTLQAGIAGKTILELSYCNQKGESSRRRVEPIGLIFYAFSWHLIGWCHYRQAYRDFKVSRICGAQVTEEPFTISTHISLSDYMQELPVAY
ncbi:MAG: DeoR family transcriptional regulator [Flaviaesturariibacter sp.]|nr:DeoR family transcriptional regulator [Flaviaesturariibacter sp.]